MSIKEKLKNHLKSVKLKLEEDEITRILNIDRIEFLNLDLLSRVIKNVKDNSEKPISSTLFRLVGRITKSVEINSDDIEKFVEEIGEYLIDEETLKKMLEKFDRASVLESARIYSNSLRSINGASIFRKNSPLDKIDIYLADAIRYTKKYISHAHDFTTFD